MPTFPVMWDGAGHALAGQLQGVGHHAFLDRLEHGRGHPEETVGRRTAADALVRHGRIGEAMSVGDGKEPMFTIVYKRKK